MVSLDDFAEIEFNVQEALWFAYEQAADELKAMGWVKPPDGERLTLEQIKSRMVNRAAAANRFRIPGASYKDFDRRG